MANTLAILPLLQKACFVCVSYYSSLFFMLNLYICKANLERYNRFFSDLLENNFLENNFLENYLLDNNNSQKSRLTLNIIETTTPFKNKFLKRLPENEPTLLFDEKGLWLALNTANQPMKIQANWLAQQKRVVNAGKKSELLLKAMKITTGMAVIDATAGMGHDSIVMAGRGAHVTMLEQQPIMHALLKDAMRQISQNANWQKLHARLSLHGVNALDYLQKVTTKVDAVYLDPMFPSDSYKSALVNKNMQILHHLAKPPTPAEEHSLLESALNAGKRVVVKRPHDAPFLAGKTPQNQWLGDVVRYDGYHL